VAFQDFWMSQHYLPATTVALEIGLFEFLGRQPTGVSGADIASGLGLGTRSVDALLAVLSGLKLVAQSGGVFTLTPLATTYMLADSQYYWGHMLLGDRSEMHARLKKVRKLQVFAQAANVRFSVWCCALPPSSAWKVISPLVQLPSGKVAS
jgi:hypothetical protein